MTHPPSRHAATGSPPPPPPSASRFRQPRARRWLSLGAAAALGMGLLATTVDARADLPVTPPGWTTVFADDFTGAAGTGVDAANWIYTTGTSYPGGPANFGTGEIQTMTSDPRNVSLDGSGNLRITPIRDGAGNWTSGRIETRRSDFQPGPGGKLAVEARIQLPNVTGAEAAGYWPAFWMLGAPYRGNWWNWPMIGEIDILENVQGINNVWATLHCGTSPGGPCGEKVGIGGQRACAPTTCQQAFHTYGMEWDRSTNPEELRWYLDGALFHTVRASQVPADTWQAATDHGYFLILNVSMGGEFPAAFGGGPTAATVSGRPMVIDYVTVRAADGSPGQPSPSQPGPSPSRPDPSSGPGARDARSRIQAESYDERSGPGTDSTGQYLTEIANGDWALYRGVDFSSRPVNQFYGRVASGACCGRGGLVEVRLDSRTSPPVSTFAIAETGGWQSWRTVPANLTPVTGVHDVYLTFTSGQPADYVNVDWISFGP